MSHSTSLPRLTPAAADTLRATADIRASGQSWDTVASILGVPAGVLIKLAYQYEEEYDRLHEKAWRGVRRDSMAEALATLRQLAKSPTEKTSFAATALIAKIDLFRRSEREKWRKYRKELRRLRDAELPEVAGQASVKEGDAAADRKPDLPRQPVVTREHEQSPAPPVVSDHVTNLRVQSDPLLLVADPLAVGGVADHNPRTHTVRGAGGAEVAAEKLGQVSDAGGAGVAAGQVESAGVNVAADNRSGQVLPDAATGVVADGVPQGPVEVDPALKAEPLPGQTGGT